MHKRNRLNKDDGNLLTGALEYKDKTVADVMTTIEKVFMLDSQTRLTFPVLMKFIRVALLGFQYTKSIART